MPSPEEALAEKLVQKHADEIEEKVLCLEDELIDAVLDETLPLGLSEESLKSVGEHVEVLVRNKMRSLL